MIRILFALLGAACSLAAQEQMNSILHLDNGATVIYQTYSNVRLNDRTRAFGSVKAAGNVIRRAMLDQNGDPWLSFQLHVERVPGSSPIRFLLSMEQPAGSPSFSHAATPREIANGDQVLLDVLEEPGTGRKVFDAFQIGIGVPLQGMPLSKSIPEVPRHGALIHLQNPRIMKEPTARDRQTGAAPQVFAQSAGTIAGTIVAISIPDKGRFVFSSAPLPGFRMGAIAEAAELTFLDGSNIYAVHLSAPVVTEAKSSYLWVKSGSDNPGISAPLLELIKAQ